MDHVVDLCENPLNFPEHINSTTPKNTRLAQKTRINEDKLRLFCQKCVRGLVFWDFNYGAKEFNLAMIQTNAQLKAHLGVVPLNKDPNPRCRFLFVHALGQNSRERLDATQEMLLVAFYFFQVIPEFSDFLFLFGRQDEAVNVLFGAFHDSARLKMHEKGLTVPEWSWSGFDMQLCYGLKSAERAPDGSASPWSIRHCAVHHTFDMVHARMNWIVIKGNQDMEHRIRDATNKDGAKTFSFETIDTVFVTALDIHLLICDWSTENWRWYIQSLENQLQNLTEVALTKNADIPVTTKVGPEIMASLNRSNTSATQDTQRSKAWSLTKSLSGKTNPVDHVTSVAPAQEKVKFTTSTGKRQPQPPGWAGPGRRAPRKRASRDDWGQQKIFFSTLQDVHNLEEKANELIAVLKLNLRIMSQLKDFYVHLFAASPEHETLKILKAKCDYDISRFKRRMDQKSSEIDLQIIRAEAFLRKLNDRKALLHALLNFEDTEVNKYLALHAKITNRNMLHMTTDMGKIARKTKTEAVSMRMITLVTLFFLPGTFIATIMSTDIVHWQNNKPNFQVEALKPYLWLTLPITFVVMATWIAFQFWKKRQEKASQELHEAQLREPDA